MRKSVALTSFILLASLLFGFSGCNSSSKGGAIDSDTKTVFLKCKEKVDVVKNSISELTMEESKEYVEPTKSLRTNDRYYNVLPKDRYLSLQNFGLYILNNVYHCVTFGYDSESVPLDAIIYDEVNNELDANLRSYLQTNNLTTQFYMQIEKGDGDYTFKVDWLGKEGFRGAIYVGGKIEMDGNNVAKFTVNSFTQDESCYAFSAHYDFVVNNFYMLCFSVDRDLGVDLLNDTLDVINKLNSGTLEYSDVEEKSYSNIYVSSGKITKNINQINYQGYVRTRYSETPSSRDEFVNLFDTVKNKFIAAKIRTSNDKLDYAQSRRVHYMNTALKYGLDTTKLYVTGYGSAVFSFVGVNDFIKMCDEVPSAFKDIFAKAKSKLSSKTSDTSLIFEDEEMKISMECKNERYFYLNTYNVDSLYYSIVDKSIDETLIFIVKGDKIANIQTTNLDYVPEDDPNYEVTVKFMTGFGNLVNSKIQQVVDVFNSQYSGKYRVELVHGGSIDGVINIIRNKAITGEGDFPEMIITKADAIATLIDDDATRKFFYNFDSFFENGGVSLTEEELEEFDQSLLDYGASYSVEGRWGLPFTTSDQYMFYNKALFEGATKQYDLPKTFDELVQVAAQIRNDHQGEDYIPVAFTDTKNIIMDLFIQNGIPVLIDKDNPLDFVENQYREEAIAILRTLKDCVDQELFSSKDITNKYVNTLFNEDKCAIGFMQSDAIDYLRDKDSIGIAKVPFANDEQAYVRANCVSSISLLKTGNPYATKGAWLFIKKLLSDFIVDYSLTSYYTPALNYDLTGSGLTGIAYDLAALHNEIKYDFVNMVKVRNVDNIYREFDQVFFNFYFQKHSAEEVLDNIINVATN